MKKVVALIILVIILGCSGYYAIVYYSHFSKGFRAGELIKISNKGVIFKTWEGEISQGVSESQRFEFSIEDKQTEVIEKMIKLQGHQVSLTYIERFGTFPWLGDTKYFITKVESVNQRDLKNTQQSVKEIEEKPKQIEPVEL